MDHSTALFDHLWLLMYNEQSLSTKYKLLQMEEVLFWAVLPLFIFFFIFAEPL